MPKPAAPDLSQIAQELYKKNLDLVNANRQLALLQKLYEIMMQEFEMEEVCEHFITTIVNEMQFDSGIVVLKNPLNSHLQAVAVSFSKKTQEALKVVGVPLHTLSISLHARHNLLVTSYRTRKKYLTKNLNHILGPVLKPDVIKHINDIVQVRSTIVFPLVFGKKTLGVFTLASGRAIGDMTDFEERVLKQIAIVFGVALDRVLLYQDLRKANLKLKDMDKRKDEFLNVAAHELRAPLTAVKGYLSMIIEGDAGVVPPPLAEFLQGAHEGAEREIRLVNNLLNVSRIEEGRLVFQMGTVQLGSVVKTVYEEFKLDAGQKGLKFELNITPKLKDTVVVDSDRIHEVVANFMSNAIKYTDKGSVSVSVTNPDAATIRFEVSDTGYGMTPEEKGKLFRKFYRAESSAGKALGTGLGLYITKLLIEKFGGSLGLESERGKGSLFWFELPISVDKKKS